MTAKDYKNEKDLWAKTLNQTQTKSYSVWYQMIYRCSPKFQKQQKAYLGCYSSDLFKDFQLFTDWYSQQIGYGEKGYSLDKDILVEGNKCYGEDFCVLVPQELNCFFVKPKKHSYTGNTEPPGIHRDINRYICNVSVDGVPTVIGRYSTIEEAVIAYKFAKEEEAFKWYKRLASGEFKIDERVVEKLKNWSYSTK